MSKNVNVRYFRTIIHVAVGFQVSGRRLLTVDPGRKITMSNLLPEDKKGYLIESEIVIRFYVS